MATMEEVSVMIVSNAAQGHINPTLRFANRLISKNVHVTIVTTELVQNRILNAHNVPSTTLNQQPSQNKQIQFEFFSDGLSLDFDREKNSETFINSMKTIGAKNMSTLITNLAKVRDYYCIIVDPVLLTDIENVSNELNIPVAFLWMQPCATFSISYRYFRNVNSFPDLNNPNEIVQLPGLPLLKVRDFPTYMLPSFPPHCRQIMVDMCQACDTNVKWVIANTVYEWEVEGVKSMSSLSPVYTVGPLVSDFMIGKNDVSNNNMINMWNVEDSCIDWLNNKPNSSVIYIAFGSIVVLTQKEVDNIANALRNSKKSFLWVIKPTLKGSENDATEFPKGFLEETKGRGLVVTWCNQEKVLSHPSVGCFLSHCGWSSMVESVTAGVPVIGYPYWLDQPTIAKIIVKQFDNGVILNYEVNEVPSVEEIERCIKEVMEGQEAKEIKKRAMDLKVSVKKALEEGGSSDKSIDQFINDVVDAHNLAKA